MPTVTIDSRRCEGKAACIEVCPMNVFELAPAPPGLPLLTRIKVAVHGGKQARVVRGEQCAGCGKCESACPERAIRVTLDE